MIVAAEPAEMRNLAIVAVLACSSCSSGSRTERPPVATEAAGERIIQVHDVADLVDPPGDAAGVAALADDLRAAVARLPVPGACAAEVEPHGRAIVVVADSAVQAQVRDRLVRLREAADAR